MFMKIYVKTSSLLSAVKKVNLGLREGGRTVGSGRVATIIE